MTVQKRKSTAESHPIRMFGQIFISFAIIAFSMVMLLRDSEANRPVEDKTLYVSLISTIVGVWLPQPH